MCFQKKIFFFSSIGTVTVAALGLISYIPGLALLGSIHSNFIPMAPSTAVSFILLATAVLLVNPPSLNLKMSPVVTLAVILITLFGLLEVLGYITNLDLNFEDKIVPDFGKLGNIPIARMSPSTGGFFFCSGVAFLLFSLSYTEKRFLKKHLSGFLSVSVLIGSITFILGYLYRTPLLYDNKTIPMALTTALGFLFLSTCLICCLSTTSFPVILFHGRSTRAKLMRTFLPLTFGAVIIQGILPSFTHNFIDINNALSSSILIVIILIVTGLAISSIAKIIGDKIDKVERERRLAEVNLQKANDELEHRVENRTEELQKALDEVKTLRGILPICSYCKKVRDDKGFWEQVDVYLHKHSEADVSHSICPTCTKKYYPEYDQK